MKPAHTSEEGFRKGGDGSKCENLKKQMEMLNKCKELWFSLSNGHRVMKHALLSIQGGTSSLGDNWQHISRIFHQTSYSSSKNLSQIIGNANKDLCAMLFIIAKSWGEKFLRDKREW